MLSSARFGLSFSTLRQRGRRSGSPGRLPGRVAMAGERQISMHSLSGPPFRAHRLQTLDTSVNRPSMKNVSSRFSRPARKTGKFGALFFFAVRGSAFWSIETSERPAVWRLFSSGSRHSGIILILMNVRNGAKKRRDRRWRAAKTPERDGDRNPVFRSRCMGSGIGINGWRKSKWLWHIPKRAWFSAIQAHNLRARFGLGMYVCPKPIRFGYKSCRERSACWFSCIRGRL